MTLRDPPCVAIVGMAKEKGTSQQKANNTSTPYSSTKRCAWNASVTLLYRYLEASKNHAKLFDIDFFSSLTHIHYYLLVKRDTPVGWCRYFSLISLILDFFNKQDLWYN